MNFLVLVRHHVAGPDGRCFLAARFVIKSIGAACMSDRNQICQNGRVSTHRDVQPGPANRPMSFSERGDACGSNLPFSGHIVNTFRRPTILQLNIEGLIACKINVLQHLAVQHEALVILLQETHCQRRSSRPPKPPIGGGPGQLWGPKLV